MHKRPAAAYEDEQFARKAREEESPTFVAHIRYTHPRAGCHLRTRTPSSSTAASLPTLDISAGSIN